MFTVSVNIMLYNGKNISIKTDYVITCRNST